MRSVSFETRSRPRFLAATLVDFALITHTARACASYLAALPSTRAIETHSLPTLFRCSLAAMCALDSLTPASSPFRVIPSMSHRFPLAPFPRHLLHCISAAAGALDRYLAALRMPLIPFAPFRASGRGRQLLFDLRQNAFHLFFAEGAHGLGLDVSQ